jgi:ABC-type transport system involved in multi-copper enzyme maturation permease subunit
MRPYIAIIKDSFREALASRVLWILLALITLKLVALAPLGIRLNLTTDFAWGDIVEGPRLVVSLRRASLLPAASPGKRIWSLIDEPTRDKLLKLRQANEGENREFFQGMEALRTSLTTLVHRRDLYDAESWEGVSPSKECRDYLAQPREQLSNDEVARMNRLLVEAAFPAHFRSRSAHSISLTYVGMDISGKLPFSKEQADSFIKQWVLSWTMSTVVGIAGVVAAILVTSTIIPQMFEPGSITLLLSKPLSRSLLFVAKFVGGCAFILLNVAYLVGGLWLILGTRFDIWNQGILWCIPIFMFMFLIYYAVSALAGLIWKSPVIAVVMTVLFWVSCFSVGTTKSIMEGLLLDQARLVKVADAGGAVVGVTEAGVVQVWDEKDNDWRQVYEPSGRGGGVPTIDGPLYHAATKQLLFGQGFRNPFGFAGQRITLRLANGSDGWTLREGPGLPSGTAKFLLEPDGSLLAVSTDNVYRLKGDPGPQKDPVKVFGFTVPFTSGGEFRPTIDEPDRSFPDPIAAAADPLEPRIVIVSGNDVTLLTRQSDGAYIETATRVLLGGEKEGSAVAIAGDFVVVAREEGKVWLLSSNDLATVREQTLERGTQPRFVSVAADSSRFAILFQNRRLWLIDGKTGQAETANIRGQGDIAGFAFAGEKLLVADRVKRVTEYNLASLARSKVYAPPMSRVEMVYYYAIWPTYLIFPKPGELDNTVQYVLTGKRTTDLGVFRGDLTQRREDLHPWRPVRSGLIFVGVVLLMACVYIERHEF